MLESERYAFSRLGLGDPIVTEDELIKQFAGLRVPEALFNQDGNIISVEVKRIIGNSLPMSADGRRRIRRYVNGKERIVWPWTSSVEIALSKLNHVIAARYNVNTHVAVFLIPETLNGSEKGKVVKRIHAIASDFMMNNKTTTKVKYYILYCDKYYFDRTD